ncbi:hypothetical protein RHGRI_007819 [Rhododendron griersonianum]|uniref:Uncharacterized protein n=1 Tax=Rhododendron griersonianum TaxID=479676 RepID=A0AAV6KY52_9ERIC|nr:hypothetical protein RHGRI_007819 [Rhododendron griersonianum]
MDTRLQIDEDSHGRLRPTAVPPVNLSPDPCPCSMSPSVPSHPAGCGQVSWVDGGRYGPSTKISGETPRGKTSHRCTFDRPNRPSPNNPISKPFDLCPRAPPLMALSSNSPPSSLKSPDVSAIGPLSPKNPSPARKLQEVFQQAGNRLESEERISSLVRSK